MILLAIDTSGPSGSLAIAEVEENTATRLHQAQWEKRAGHSELATVQLMELLKDARIQLRDITHIVVNIGPGSFTGIRVGMSLARSLAYSLDLPILGISSLENLAHAFAKGHSSAFVALKAVQNFYYCASFSLTDAGPVQTLAPRSADFVELPELAKPSTKVLIEGQTPGFAPGSLAEGLIELALQTSKNRNFLTWKSVEPLYIRGSEAEEKLKRGILKPLK